MRLSFTEKNGFERKFQQKLNLPCSIYIANEMMICVKIIK